MQLSTHYQLLLLHESLTEFAQSFSDYLSPTSMDSNLENINLIKKHDLTQNVRVNGIFNDKWLQYLATIIDKIFDISVVVNNHYGKIVLFALLSSFVCITAQVYYFISVCRKFSLYKHPEISLMTSCVLVSLHIVEMGIIFPLGSKIKAEVQIISFW